MKIRWLNKMCMVKKEDGVLLNQEQRIKIEKQLQKAYNGHLAAHNSDFSKLAKSKLESKA